MSIDSYFFNAELKNGKYDREYSALDLTNYLRKIVSDGVFPNPSSNLQVQAQSGMNIVVKAGEGMGLGHKIVNNNDLILTVEQSDVALNRLDRVVYYVDFINRLMGIRIKKGTLGASPVAPELTRNEDVYEYSLATILVNKQVTSISQSNITDTRGDSNVCGWVVGLIKEVDTSTLFDQWNTAFDEKTDDFSQQIANNQNEFNQWFENVKNTLSTATLLRTFKSLYKTQKENETVIPINIPQYKNEYDILEVYINGLRLNDTDYIINLETSTVTLSKGIDVIGTPIECVVYKSVDGSKAETVIQQVEELQQTKADKQVSRVTLLATGWTDKKQVLNVSGVLPNSILIVDTGNGGIRATEQGTGTVTFTCDDIPAENINVRIINLGIEI